MTNTTRSLLAMLFFALAMLMFFLAANDGYHLASPSVFGIIGFIFVSVVIILVRRDWGVRR